MLGSASFSFNATHVFPIVGRLLVFAGYVESGSAKPGDWLTFEADGRILKGEIKVIEHEMRCVSKTLPNEHIGIALVGIVDQRLEDFFRSIGDDGLIPAGNLQRIAGIRCPITLVEVKAGEKYDRNA